MEHTKCFIFSILDNKLIEISLEACDYIISNLHSKVPGKRLICCNHFNHAGVSPEDLVLVLCGTVSKNNFLL